MDNTFKALIINESVDGFAKEIQKINLSELPKNDLLIKVSYSSINYKDTLSARQQRSNSKVSAYSRD